MKTKAWLFLLVAVALFGQSISLPPVGDPWWSTETGKYFAENNIARIVCQNPEIYSDAVCSDAWVIIGEARIKCDQTGCNSTDVFWTGTETMHASDLPAGWSDDWKLAEQWAEVSDIHYAALNGRHCCYVENAVRIDQRTGKIRGYGPR